MRVTKDVELGIDLIKFLNTETPVSLLVFCHRTRFTLPFTEQVARRLKLAGLIESKRGPNGGYILAKKSVTVFEVYKALKGHVKSYRMVIDNKAARSSFEQFLMTQMQTKKAA